MEIATSDGVELAADVAGDPAAPPVVLVHGFGGVKEDWSEQLDRLAEYYRVVAFDHRGHGESGRPDDPGAYSLDRMAADTLDVADALGFERFCLVGTSMGGMVGQRLALSAPSRLTGLVLQCTWPGPPTGFASEDAHKAAAVALDRGMPALLDALGDDALTTPIQQQLVAEKPGYAEYCDAKFLAQSPVMYARMVVEIMDQGDVADRLVAIHTPTLVVGAEQDAASLVGCERIAEVVPGARMVVVPVAGHNPQLENPSGWWDAVTPFLETVAR